MTDTPNAQASTADFEFAALWEARNYRKAIVKEFSRWLRGHVLEVGCGIGQMSREFLNHPPVERITCIEPDDGFVREHAIAVPEATLIHGTAADLPADCNADCIISINVLEHIERDETEMARYTSPLKKHAGRLCVLVPARPEIYAPLDKDFGHFRRYTKAELRGKLERAGFVVEHLHYFNFIGYFAWWFSFKLRGQRSFGITQVRMFDRLIFPVANGLERCLIRPPVGQSLIAVAYPR